MPATRSGTLGFFIRVMSFKPLRHLAAIALLGFVLVRAWDPPGQEGMTLKRLLTDHLAAGNLDFIALVSSMALLATAISFTIIRWHLLLSTMGLGIPAQQTARLGWIGFYFNTLLPGSIGGDLIKATVVARRFPGRRVQAVATVLLDRGFALWNLVLFVALVSMALPPAHQALARIGAWARAFCLLTLLLWFLLGYLPLWRAERFALRLRRWFPGAGMLIGELWLALFRYRQNPATIMVTIALSAVSQAAFIISVERMGAGLRLGESMPSFEHHFLLVPMAMMMNAIPLFPGGIGIGEWGYGTLYSMLGGEESVGVAVSLGHRLENWILAGMAMAGVAVTRWDEPPDLATDSASKPVG